MVVLCCVCKKRRQGDLWVDHKQDFEANAEGIVSHGYCPECAAKAFKEISDYMTGSASGSPPVEPAAISEDAKRVFPAA